MNRCLAFLFLAGLAGQVQGLHAQRQALHFEHIREVNPFVFDIHQDREGFLWVGGENLYRYDGQRFKEYFHIPGDTTSLSGSNIKIVYEDRAGTMWVGTDISGGGAGLNRYDRGTDTFTRFVNDPNDPASIDATAVYAVHEDRAGRLWVGTLGGGLYWFDRENERFTPLAGNQNGPESQDIGGILFIYEDRAGTLWVGTTTGLSRYDPSGLQTESGYEVSFEHFRHDPLDPASIGQGAVRTILEDSKGRFWVGTGGGLCRMDRPVGTFSCYRYEEGNPKSLSDANVFSLVEDSSGVFWVGTSPLKGQGGLNRFDPATGAFDRFQYDPENPTSISNNNVWTLLQDRLGVLWIGTFGGGLNKLKHSASLFTAYQPAVPDLQAWDTMEDRSGGLWVTSGVGIHRLERSGWQWETFIHDPDDPGSLDPGPYKAIYQDLSGVIWVGTGIGLDRFDSATGTFTHFTHDPEDATPFGEVMCIHEDPQGRFWVGLWEIGLNLMDRNTGRFMRFSHDPHDPTSIGLGTVNFMLEDSQGRFWIATNADGLNLMDREEGTFTRFTNDPQDPKSLSSNDPGVLFEDAAGVLWVGSFWDGLDQFDPELGRVRGFNTQNSCLPHNRIAGILGDKKGNLWLNTGRGIVKFDPELETCTVYEIDKGLKGITGIPGSLYENARGEFFFGTISGVYGFFPDAIPVNAEPPPVVLTEFYLSNRPVHPGSARVLSRRITETEEIVLRYNQNSIGFEFAALDYVRPEQNKFAYKLEFFNEDWISDGAQPRANYTNLSPGDYVFRAKAANSDGIWNEEGASVRVVILPPLWRTTLAYVVYGLLFAVGVFVVDRYQRRRLIARERLRAEREKAKAIESTNNELQRALKHLTETQDQLIHTEKMASLGQLTAGIAHEIKNPLNFVNNFAELCSDQAGEIEDILARDKALLSTASAHELKAVLDDLKLNARKINEHGRRADGIIRSMLEHSRTSTGDRRAVDVNRLLDEYVNLAYHGVRAREEGFEVDLKRSYDEAAGDIEIIPQEIGRVFINLLDNAFYAVNEKRRSVNGAYDPEVSVRTKRKDSWVEVHIADNGIGIREELQDKIFEPFFTTKPAGSGTGLGLSLSYDIVVKGHGGSLAVESEAGEGATFVVSLPLEDGK